MLDDLLFGVRLGWLSSDFATSALVVRDDTLRARLLAHVRRAPPAPARD